MAETRRRGYTRSPIPDRIPVAGEGQSAREPVRIRLARRCRGAGAWLIAPEAIYRVDYVSPQPFPEE
jgi:hypothetical protein